MIQWERYDTLITEIARRRVVLVLGSGISRNSVNRQGVKPLMWEGFLRKALLSVEGPRDIIEGLIEKNDYLTACEVIFDKLGRDRFNRIAEDSFLRPGFQSHVIHEHIFNLDARIVATPNVDKIYDTYANGVTEGTILVKNYYDDDLADKIRSQDNVIIKIHGTIEQPNKMIFTRRQYTNARYEYSGFYQILNALALTHTFMFLGCGYSDPDIRLILENYAYMYPNCRPHYMVTPNNAINEDIKASLRVNCNLDVITYDSANDHQELVDSLGQLVTMVDEERDAIQLSMKW